MQSVGHGMQVSISEESTCAAFLALHTFATL